MSAPRTYKGVVIFHNTQPGKLPYTARAITGAPLSADTLEGIKALIREAGAAT